MNDRSDDVGHWSREQYEGSFPARKKLGRNLAVSDDVRLVRSEAGNAYVAAERNE